MPIDKTQGVQVSVNGYGVLVHPQKFRELAAQKLKGDSAPKIEGSDLHQLQADLEAAYAGVEFTPDEVRQFAFHENGDDIPQNAALDHNSVVKTIVGNLDYAAAMGLVTIVKPKTDEVKIDTPNPADAKGVTGEPAADEPGAADETGDIEGERVDEGALGDQGGGGEGPKKPGFWARFGSWILGGLGILSAIGAFFAHAEGKLRAFFAIVGGLLLGGAIVNKWHGFGEAIFGKTVKTPKTEGTEVAAPEGVTP